MEIKAESGVMLQKQGMQRLQPNSGIKEKLGAASPSQHEGTQQP